jgi:4-hydroxy-2-oxoheptanedioate aldolase
MRENIIKRELQAGNPCVGTWLSLGNVIAARFMARVGFHWLTVDIEHSSVGWETAGHMFATIADSGCTALARVPSNRHDHIKRVLDSGAMGIVVPMVNSREEALAAVAAAKYPPQGNRSVGGNVHALNFAATPAEYYARANDEIVIVLQCEHIEAVRHADEIFSVPGIDAIFVGPNDLAASMRGPKGEPPSADETNQAMRAIFDACRRHNVAAGVHCMNVMEAEQRVSEGWQFIAITSELKMMLDGAAAVVGPLLGDACKGETARY